MRLECRRSNEYGHVGRLGQLRLLGRLLLLLPLGAAPVVADELENTLAVPVDELVRFEDARQGSLLLKTDKPGLFVAAPMLDTRIDLQITGIIVRAVVTQEFSNPTDLWVEGVYLFPLPETAAVDHLVMRVGDRLIVGQIHEKKKARKIYQKAKREGRKATLLAQKRPNVFKTSVASIGPQESIEITIEYQHTVGFAAGSFNVRLPLVVAPRYGGIPDVEPVAHPDSGHRNSVQLTVDLNFGTPLSSVSSSSHEIVWVESGVGRYMVIPATPTIAALRDFVLEWTPHPSALPQVTVLREKYQGDEYALLMILPPTPSKSADLRGAREVIFVIDTSGSMHGGSLEQAKAAVLLALKRLQPYDQFNVIQFNSATERLFPGSVPVGSMALRQAREYVEGLKANGGTEMQPALQAALDGEAPPGVLRQIVFVTDGAVGNEAQLFAYLEQHLGSSRLFPVGIGSAPNSFFMRQAAEFGRGSFTHIGQLGEVAERMQGLFQRLERPVLTDIEPHWSDPTAESWPQRVFDLYSGEPIFLVTRCAELGDGLELRGYLAGRPWQQLVALPPAERGRGIEKLWARRKIAHLMASVHFGAATEEVRGSVLRVALDHHLVSRYTSLVAVDMTMPTASAKRQITRPIRLQLPAGWSYDRTVGIPQTATWSRLWLIAGWLLLTVWLACLKPRRPSVEAR